MSLSHKNLQIPHGQISSTTHQGKMRLLSFFIYYRVGESLCFSSLFAFTHKTHRQQKQEICPLAPGF